MRLTNDYKIAALDIGDRWVGVALSDVTHTLAKPLVTLPYHKLQEELATLCAQHKIGVLVIGNPKTMRGTESAQTVKTQEIFKQLQEAFPQVRCLLWDERLSSKRAQAVAPARTKEEKNFAHARAAAFILDSYLSYLKVSNFQEEE